MWPQILVSQPITIDSVQHLFLLQEERLEVEPENTDPVVCLRNTLKTNSVVVSDFSVFSFISAIHRQMYECLIVHLALRYVRPPTTPLSR